MFGIRTLPTVAGWVSIFHGGTGAISVWASSGGTRGALLMTETIPLTPGPLVVSSGDSCHYYCYFAPSTMSTLASGL